MSLNDRLSKSYPQQATAEELQKVASFDAFTKVAADQGINLLAYSDEQIGRMYEAYAAKVAESAREEEEEEKEDEVKERAKKEHEARKEAAAQIAWAQGLGWEMFAGFNEAQKLASAIQSGEISDEELDKMASEGGGRFKAFVEKVKGHASAAGDKVRGAGDKVRGAAYGAVGREHLDEASRFEQAGLKDLADRTRGEAKKELHKRMGVAAGGTAAAGAVAAGGVAAHKHHKGKSEGGEGGEGKTASIDDNYSASDLAAAKLAHQWITAAGWEPVQAERRLLGLLEFGLAEGEAAKTAAAGSADDYLEARALEFVAAAQYPLK